MPILPENPRAQPGPAMSSAVCLCEHFLDDFARHHGWPFSAAVVHIRDTEMVETQSPQHGRMNIVHVRPALRCVHAEFVGGAYILTALRAAARHPNGETPGIVIAAQSPFVE